MLSDEEKKAIKNLRLNVTNVGFSVYDGTTSLFKMRDIQTILNLIEKQSKEIEELNKALMTATLKIEGLKIEAVYNDNYISKDKIKAKIEEYKKQIEKMEKDDIGRGFTLGKEWSDLKAKVEFGQSLLEKE